MKKMIIKLTAAGLSLVLAVTVAVMSSYAWLTLSESPAANGIYVAVGGGNTILLAPDLTKELEGQTYHYPGAFSDTLNFNQHQSYSYLSELGGMTPVSTSDGINWLLPTYYQKDDPEVTSDAVANGSLKPLNDFMVDSSLQYANLTSTQTDLISQGSYIYLDFWVVSPGADYRLRVSTGDEDNAAGSFVIGLMEPEEIDTNEDGLADSYQLLAKGDAAAASARVGFLVNESDVTDNSMLAYITSPGYSDQFDKLRGIYPSKGESPIQAQHRFMIYEPNGTLHPEGSDADNGSYVITEPLAYLGSYVYANDVSSNLTVQDTSGWKTAESGTGDTVIEQIFQGMTATEGFRSSTLQELKNEFYIETMQGQVGAYVNKGSFFKSTDRLYQLSQTGQATAQYIEQERSNTSSGFLAGATDDAYIVDLERNVPQRIRMFIWLEGQDVDCINDARESGIVVSIELAGSNNGI